MVLNYILVGCPWSTSCSRMNHTDTSFLMLFSNSLNYSCCWKPINNNHNFWVRWMNLDTQWNTRSNTTRFLSEIKTLAVAFLLFHLRRKGKNLVFVLHHGLQNLRTDESTRPTASCFHLFLGVWHITLCSRSNVMSGLF